MPEKEFDNILERIFETSIFIFVGIIISKIFSYIYKIIIARYFGVEIYGLYSLSLVIILLFALVSGFGISEGILRYISLYRGKNENDKIRYLFRMSMKILLFSTITIAIISFFLAEFISLTIFKNPSLTIYLKIFSFLIPIWIFAGFFHSIMIAFEKVKQQTIIEKIVQSSAKLGFLLIFLALGLKTNAVIFSFFLGIVVFFIATYLYCKYSLSTLFLDYNLNNSETKKIRKNLLSYSLPIMFFGMAFYLFYWTDSLVLGFFKTTTEVGIYNAAIPIALLLSLAPELFITLLFPIITKQYARKNMGLIRDLSKQIGKWIFIINFPLFFLMVLFPGAIINLFFGSEYLLASNALRFLLLANLFASLIVISHKLLLMVGKTKILLMDLLIATVLNFVLNVILVPMPFIFGFDNASGLNGAAISTFISILVFNSLIFFHARKYTSITPLSGKLYKIILIAIIPIIILFFIRSSIVVTNLSLILLTISFILVYLLLLFLMKGLDKDDMYVIETLKGKLSSKINKNRI
jgi:O-antigen/teichoic acid export membrane protein